MIDEIRQIFTDAHVYGAYVRIRCPYHKGGNEKNASMGILLQDKPPHKRGFCHCFTCGWSGTIEKLFADKGYAYIETTTDAPKAAPVSLKLQLEPSPIYTKHTLPWKYSPYLASRRIDTGTQERFRVFEKGGKVYMPVFDRDGLFLYANARSTAGKYFFMQEGAQKTLAYIEEIDYDQPVYVCESQINALSLWHLGLQAVATLSSTNVAALEQVLAAKQFILAFDPDEAGERATQQAVELLGAFRCKYLKLPREQDVNDILVASKDDIECVTTIQRIIKRIPV